MKTILIIDGQGGRVGTLLTERLKNICPAEMKEKIKIIAVGTNAMATSAMIKAGADNAATGENACVVCASKADIIAGPIGIVIADSLLGEVTEKMASAVGKSGAVRVLVPVNRCDNIIAGVNEAPMSELVKEAADHIIKLI